MQRNPPLTIHSTKILAGERRTLDLPVSQLYTHTPITMPVHVVHGRQTGPRLFVCAALHGDELNGIEIIRRLLTLPALNRIKGTLLAVPIVNVLGVIHQSRYLPDRRDLNRNFPGSEKGSLAARLAHLFMVEVVAHATHGIDLHTGALHRSNLPQVRGHLADTQTAELARAFGAPVMLNAAIRDDSLREAASARGIPIIVYESGEALRFDELGIRAGMKGIINVMRYLGMLPHPRRMKPAPEPILALSSGWVRATDSGILRAMVALGARVRNEQQLGAISSPFGDKEHPVLAPYSGIVIGRTNIPLVHEGEALFHIARFDSTREAAQQVRTFQSNHTTDDDLLFPDEPPIV